MSGILDGINVLDLSRILAGPYTAQMLSDLGANVTKIEAPWGDDTRGWGPPFATDFDGERVAAYFLCCNLQFHQLEHHWMCNIFIIIFIFISH